MTIETKFNINDLVQHKFQRPIREKPQQAIAFEVIEINSICCYTTAQVFYVCRPIHAIVEEQRDEKFKRIFELVNFAAGRLKDTEYLKFREDEIKICDESLKALILNHPIDQ